MNRLPEIGSSLANVMVAAPSEEQLLADAAEQVRYSMGADACDIFLGDQSVLTLRASTSHPDLVGRVRQGSGAGLAGGATVQNKPLVIPEGLNEREAYRRLPWENLPFQSALVVPLPEDSAPLGSVIVYRSDRWAISDMEVVKLVRLTAELSTGLRIYRAAFEAGSQANRLGVLSEVTKTLTDSPYLEEILQLLVNLTARRFNYKVVTVRLLDEKRQELVLRATQANNRAYQNKRAIRLGESIAGRAIQSGQIIVVEDVQASEEYIGHDLAEEQGLRSMACIPLLIGGKAVGVLSCYTGEVREFTEDELAALETLANQAAVMIEHAKLQVRNTLMQEMHHRVKNNLQQIASLLRLQLRQSHYKNIEEALNDSLSRILAIAAVHELLSRDDLDHVSIKSIAETLGHHMQQSLLMPAKHIAFSVGGDEVYLNTNQATQVALILNEMVSNAVEHGFENRREGEIHINVEQRGDEVGLWVSNNGDPLPDGFDPTGGQLGLQIIRSLAGALGGKFVISDRLGWTVCEVKFTRQLAE